MLLPLREVVVSRKQCCGSGSASGSAIRIYLDPHPHQIKIQIRIRIRTHIKVISWIRNWIRINLQMTSQNMEYECILALF
jgi:hypothetical protein